MGKPLSILSLQGICAYYGELQALFDIDLDLTQGDILALIGANGAGKSTLLRTLTGLTTVGGKTRLTGRMAFEGQPIESLPPERIVEMGIALVPEGRRLFSRMSVEDNLLCGAYLPIWRQGARRKLDEIYALFPRLAERRRQIVTQMSGGEQQMVAIGRALMTSPRLLLLDEVSLGLSPAAVEELYGNLQRLRNELTIIVVEQDLQRAMGFAGRAAVMLEGRVVLANDISKLSREEITTAYFGGSGHASPQTKMPVQGVH
ncbi:ABC transporter ATP-binding protein (plasmid) [Shinella sp. H4-D48]|uniref:ABC transporter ATP-binding protein n=1 Tax=Shinella sp. H4-D48 TaxID=2925841 RepID=UPI001F532FBF|nr:ABC transporter ATP-binding protein [Shinella sp. H4-D48]UNK39960.1 ABC transporter ATP-binding protein [Shinella sp. H4-D48]